MSDLESVLARLRSDRWTAGVVGLGYVGLPLAVTASQAGLDVIGFDVLEDRVQDLQEGRSHVEDVSDEELTEAVARNTRFTTDASALSDADAIFVAVPSPLGRNRQPDMSFIEAATEIIRKVVRAGQLVCLESTTYPGTTEEYLVAAVEGAGLVVGEDAWICFSPERVDPGNILHTGDIPKVVGGITETCGQVGVAAYGRVVGQVHRVSTARAAELTKLLENTYRAVNIALVNELAQLAHVFDIDIWEVVDAAATKPFGYQPFYPGPGVGGHCIPLDPQFLAWRARELRATTRFIDLAEDVNLHMPDYVAARVIDELNARGLPVYGTKILGVGVAYKRDVGDDRESPSHDVLARLARRGADVGVLDPYVSSDRLADFGYASVEHDDMAGYRVAVVLTDHSKVDYAAVAESVDFVFDTRGVYRRLGLKDANVVVL